MDNFFICPFCNASNPIIAETTSYRLINFFGNIHYDHQENRRAAIATTSLDLDIKALPSTQTTFVFTLHRCVQCKKTEIFATGVTADVKNVSVKLNPKFSCKKYPDYVPKAIREDYEEASEILAASPKAAATLARRCMQGIIRDFWGVSGKNLSNEIDLIKAQVDPEIWEALDSLRQLGNIGAHMEKDINLIVDIDPEEADSLLKFIELLIEEWYIAREKKHATLKAIPLINAQKQDQRKN